MTSETAPTRDPALFNSCGSSCTLRILDGCCFRSPWLERVAVALLDPPVPFELKGIFVEPTENLVGLEDPPRSYNWVGEFEGLRIDYSAHEIGHALRLLLRGDGSVLERILAPLQVIERPDMRELPHVARGAINQRFFGYYRNFGRGVMHRSGDQSKTSVNHLLAAYRAALTGSHLLRTGEMKLELTALAKLYGVGEIEELVEHNQRTPFAMLENRGRWAKVLVQVHSRLEEAIDLSELPQAPENPNAAEEFLLDLRRRFFDAVTLQ